MPKTPVFEGIEGLSLVRRKRFGQHFLRDPEVIERTVAAIAPRRGQRVVEIGPGTGALTRALVETLETLDVIEMDRDLAAGLQDSLGTHTRVRIHRDDALKFDLCSLASPGAKIRLVGNLPYNISSPLLFHVLDHLECVEDMVFMLQKEVAERITAAPSTRCYGRLSVMVRYRCDADLLFVIGPTAFAPPPKVDSALIRLAPRPLPETLLDDNTFARVVTHAFAHRRKTLHNALRGMIDDVGLHAAGISPSARGETLSVSEFVRLANYIARPG
jgi:16S rRNA (adenine1518-N6/adenine1519-N6)-dimethyltransferase